MAWLGERAAANWYWLSITAFLAFAMLETLRPDGRVRAALAPRWLAHMAVYAADLLLSSALLPGLLVLLIAGRAAAAPTGAFRAIAGWAGGGRAGELAVLAVGLVAIDFVVYWAHRLQHRVHLLWRFHALHHADADMDVSTALLHHPVAYLLVGAMVGAALGALGLPAWVFSTYGVFEIAGGVFQHVATPVPDGFERRVRWLLVTPGMHRAHHSSDPAHHDTNFANLLSIWDRLFGTFLVLDGPACARLRYGVPDAPPEPMTVVRKTVGAFTFPTRLHPALPPSGEPRPTQTVE